MGEFFDIYCFYNELIMFKSLNPEAKNKYLKENVNLTQGRQRKRELQSHRSVKGQ